jgi:hypothetical protein
VSASQLARFTIPKIAQAGLSASGEHYGTFPSFLIPYDCLLSCMTFPSLSLPLYILGDVHTLYELIDNVVFTRLKSLILLELILSAPAILILIQVSLIVIAIRHREGLHNSTYPVHTR